MSLRWSGKISVRITLILSTLCNYILISPLVLVLSCCVSLLLLLLFPEFYLFSLVSFPAECGTDELGSCVPTPLLGGTGGAELEGQQGWQGVYVSLELRVKGDLGWDNLCFLSDGEGCREKGKGNHVQCLRSRFLGHCATTQLAAALAQRANYSCHSPLGFSWVFSWH